MIDSSHKKQMRDRIMAGPPFNEQERAEILAHCEEDVVALVELLKRMTPTIRSLPHALGRGKVMWPNANIESRGVPLNLPLVTLVRDNWTSIQLGLVREFDEFGLYEIDKHGKPHWKDERFESFVARMGIDWPKLDSGKLDQKIDTFEDMQGIYPWANSVRELRSTMSKLRMNSLEIGGDGRNRTPLWPYGSKTGRSQPSTSAYIFGPSKWTRSFVAPAQGSALVCRDYCQQEVNIAATWSGDPELLVACLGGDVYLGTAILLGCAPPDATAESHGPVRDLFKTVTLGIIYGLGAKTLASRTGLSLYEAGEIRARLRARYRRFEDDIAGATDRAGLDLELSTVFGWCMRCPPGTNPRTIRNYPMQSSGSECLHAACVLAERRGIKLVATIHDALIAEGPVEDIEDISIALDRLMRDASSIVLNGYELRTDEKIICSGPLAPAREEAHYHDKRGEAMFNKVVQLAKEARQ